ncbi:MAG TPA: tetratricopeptide repeat protein [Bryobacteraceae bacterium]|nr:tetratricopeptide repeat protein [Bryobacteraceae bacterium]
MVLTKKLYLLLFIATLLVYSQVINFAFISFDDTQGLLGNPQVRDGLSWDGIVWAFTTGYASNWFPVTWFSHMLDFQLFGMAAGWHHLTNVLIHAVSAVLLMALLKRMTGRVWESAFVAFVFALHPLHVESVAWVSERKDVLFAFFWFLTTWLYLDFIANRTIRNYLLMAGAFCLGLMSKQMIVTLPFTLLLLDAWPLRRKGLRTLILEKVPLVALSIAASFITLLAQEKGGAVQSLASIPLSARAANALMAYVIYIANFIWPTGLAFFYPYPPRWPMGEVAFAGLALAAMSIAVVWAYRRRPYLAVGWFWYLGTLAPVIGLIQVGHQARADRYTYVPLIGISIMVAWAAAEAFTRWPQAKNTLAGIAIAACVAWTVAAWVQIQYWKDSAALYNRAIAVTNANYLAHLNLGVDLAEQGQYQTALRELYTSIEENPDQPHARNSLGGVLYNLGRKDEAIEQFSQAIRLAPQDAEPHCNLGNALVDAGRIDDAIGELNTALRMNPGMANAYYGLGRVLVLQHRPADAATYFSAALKINPNFGAAREQLRALGSQ